jgi:hypothetical protein
MPRDAMLAALETFAQITRERHPGVVLVPLGPIGADRAAVAAGAGEVLWPFAAPWDAHAFGGPRGRGAEIADDRFDRAA